jgi:Flp pilus assembly protein TadB
MVDSTLPGERQSGERVGLIGLVRQLPGQVSRLIRDEIRAAQMELTEKLKAAGVGAGLLVGGAVLALFAIGALVAAAILGLAEVLAPWLSALIVGVVLLLIAGALALVGQRRLKKGMPPLPQDSIESVKADIRTVKGVNR